MDYSAALPTNPRFLCERNRAGTKRISYSFTALMNALATLKVDGAKLGVNMNFTSCEGE